LHCLEQISESALKMSRLIDDLLDFSRIVSGKLRLAVRPVEVGDIIQAAVESMRPAADAKGLYLQLGAFSARDNADALRARLERDLSWLDRGIEVLPVDGLFRVRLGPYRDRGEADGVATRIREVLDLKAVVIVR